MSWFIKVFKSEYAETWMLFEEEYRDRVPSLETPWQQRDWPPHIADDVAPDYAPLLIAAPDLYAACKATEEADRLLIEFDTITQTRASGGAAKWKEWQAAHERACKLMGAAIRKAEGSIDNEDNQNG